MVDLEEVSVPKTYTVESEDIILPEIAYKMGYTFLGWFLNGEKVEKLLKEQLVILILLLNGK